MVSSSASWTTASVGAVVLWGAVVAVVVWSVVVVLRVDDPAGADVASLVGGGVGRFVGVSRIRHIISGLALKTLWCAMV